MQISDLLNYVKEIYILIGKLISLEFALYVIVRYRINGREKFVWFLMIANKLGELILTGQSMDQALPTNLTIICSQSI